MDKGEECNEVKVNDNDKEKDKEVNDVSQDKHNGVTNIIPETNTNNANGNSIANTAQINRLIPKKRKRRSKLDFDGRSFRCPECGKSYLSMPALTNHRKSKHDYGKFGERKGRGRPRKEPLIINPIDSTEKKFKNFFEKEFRKLIPGERIEYDQIDSLLKNIFTSYKTNFALIKTDVYQKYPFFSFILSNWDLSQLEYESYAYEECDDSLSIKNPKTIDLVLLIYLKECATRTCSEYFDTILRFVVLFREGINKIKQNENKENEINDSCLYTEKYNAQEIPDLCNTLIEEYFENNYFFGLDTKDLAEIIQHICYWMYNSNYTTSRLTIA